MTAGLGSATKPRRRTGFVILAIVLTFAALELISFVGLSSGFRRWMTPGALQELRARLSDQQLAEDSDDDPEKPYATQYAVHPYLGYVLDATFDTASRLETGGADAINYGFQLVEEGIFHPDDDRTLVVALTGGSVAFGLTLHFHDELRSRVLERTGADIDRVVIVNLALPGYKQPQQVLLLNYLLALGARFDMVVNLDGFNEIALAPAENLPNHVSPIFPHAWYYRIADFDPESRVVVGELMIAQRQRQRSARFFDTGPWNWSSTAGLLWASIDRYHQRRINRIDARTAELQASRVPNISVTGPDRGYVTPKDVVADLAHVWEVSSRLLHGVCNRSGIGYLHFLQPNQYVPGSKPMSDRERASIINPELPSGPYAELGYPLLRARGSDLSRDGIPFFDLTMLFSSTPEPTYSDDCCHYTELGERMVASVIADEIATSYHRAAFFD